MIDDLASLTPDLASLGWDDELQQWSEGVDSPDGDDGTPLIRGRIAQVSRGFSLIFTGGDAVLVESASTRARTDLVPATGDYVVFDDGSDPDRSADSDGQDDPALVAVAPRRTELARRAAGRIPEPQVLAANVDSVFVMQGLDRDVNLRRIERQLVVAWDSGAEPVVVLTKADQIDDPDTVVSDVSAIAPGVTVLATSTVTGRGIDQIAAKVTAGQTVALLGLSGIGKSTLVNELTGGIVQRTGEVRTADRRGRHTTVTRDLIPIPDGGMIIDTPGIREIGLWQAYDGLAKTFPEISAEVDRCRFADCEHVDEPGCAVSAGLADGLIPHRRLEHWRDLSAELALQETQLEEFAKRSESRDRAEAERRRDSERPNSRSRRKPSRRSGRSGRPRRR